SAFTGTIAPCLSQSAGINWSTMGSLDDRKSKDATDDSHAQSKEENERASIASRVHDGRTGDGCRNADGNKSNVFHLFSPFKCALTFAPIASRCSAKNF